MADPETKTATQPATRPPPGAQGSWLTNMRERARQWGWHRAFYWQIMHAFARGLGFHVHYVTIGADRPRLLSLYREPPRVPDGYSVRFGCKEDFLKAVGKVPNVDFRFIEEAFGRGDECSIVLHGDELVNFCFWTRAWAPVTDQLRVIVPEGFRYVYKAWTHADHRRKGLSNVNSYWRNTRRVAPFEERSISYVETHNYASLLRSYQHPNERGIYCGYVGWITLFGREIPFSTRQARWIGLRFTSNPP